MKATRYTDGNRRHQERITLFIADDHAILRSGVRRLLESQSDMKVIGEAADGVETLKKAKELQPKIVLLDISMPKMNIANTIMTIGRNCPSTKVLILMMHEDSVYVKTTLEAGASGYVSKRMADTDLLTAMREIQKGRLYVNLQVGDRSRNIIPTQFIPNTRRKNNNNALPLNPREKEVLLLVAKGFTNQEIASQLSVSIKSIETYRLRLMEKLNLNSRADLVQYVINRALLPLSNKMVRA